MDRNKGTHLRRKMKFILEEYNYTWYFPILLSELTFNVFLEYVITRRNIKIGKYLFISYNEKLHLSLIFFHCEKFSMTDDMYNRLTDLMAGTKRTIACMKQSTGESCNSGESPLSLGAYIYIFQILISSTKPEHIFEHFFKNSGVVSYGSS